MTTAVERAGRPAECRTLRVRMAGTGSALGEARNRKDKAMLPPPAVILLATANPNAADPVADTLRDDGHATIIRTTTATTVDAISTKAPDLAVIWLELPDSHGGFNLIGKVRTGESRIDPRLPLIVVDPAASELNCLRAFQHGADDYLDAACSLLQLRARIDALLRRCRNSEKQALLTIGPLEINTENHRASIGGHNLTLSRKEFALLSELASQPGRVFSKTELLRNVWDYPPHLNTRTLHSHASRLRRKMLALTTSAQIENVWGVGYRLTETRQQQQVA
jgi:DNA-binding response OmpR family regulator